MRLEQAAELLNIRADSSLDEIKSAFRNIAADLHADNVLYTVYTIKVHLLPPNTSFNLCCV